MTEPRVKELAHLLVNHSCRLGKGDRVLIESIGAPNEIVISLIREANAVDAVPFVTMKDDRVIRELCCVYDEDDVKTMAACELDTLKRMDAFISIRAPHNAQEYAEIPKDKLKNMLRNYVQPVHFNYRNDNLRWVCLRWPTSAMAQRAGMSTESFEDFFFSVCSVDPRRLDAAMTPLVDLLDRTRNIRIQGPGDTMVTFSVDGMTSYKSIGYHNLPDGELFTAPVRDSVEGHICFNVTSTYYGTTFRDVCVDIRKGKIVKAVSTSDSDRLNDILDQDEGARYIGEFAFGLNPLINQAIDDILFDEKMAGSVHFAAGNAYTVCDNGNRSAIHWDLILNQAESAGGGCLYFDDVLIRRDGCFVLPELTALNPDEFHKI